ncbi:FtsX-like permease family protein [Companilactobacillus musae]|uniref:ABC transporter permease n=1 Tax=Companilactobacillus musae TaxID=1903258 RepID=UPI000E65A8A9|nr:FtsX-like permease family protein [Companilactobacillus musae]
MYLTLKELRHDKLKFTALGLIIFLIVFLVLFITGLANGLANDSGSAIKESSAQTFVLEKNSQARLNRSTLNNQDWKKFSNKYHHNAAKLSVNQMTIQKASQKNKKTDITYYTINADSFLNPKITDGQKLTNKNNNQVIVSSKLKAEGYKLGDKFKDSTSNQAFTISGFTKNQAYSHTPVIFLNQKQTHRILPQVNSFNTIALKAKNIKNSNYQVANKKSVINAIPGYSAEQGSLYLMIGFLYIISLFVLAVFFYIINLQKLSDFGTLKALGTSTAYLVKHVLSEMSLLSISSIVISSVITYLIKLKMPATMPFDLSPTIILGTGILFLAITLISAILSLIKVIKVDPITAIGGNN